MTVVTVMTRMAKRWAEAEATKNSLTVTTKMAPLTIRLVTVTTKGTWMVTMGLMRRRCQHLL